MKKLIFIHIPRCGGTSVELALKMFYFLDDGYKQRFDKAIRHFFAEKYYRYMYGYGIKDGKAMQHFLYSDYIKLLGKKAFDGYYKFAIVRNPYTRFVSTYHWCQIEGIGKIAGQSIDDFISYCEEIVKKGYYNLTIYHDHMIPQYKFIYDDNNKLMVDDLFRVERYGEVVKMLKDRYGVSPKKEFAAGYDKAFSLTSSQKKRIYNIYKRDFELLKYNE